MIDIGKLKVERQLGCGCSTFGGSVSKKTALKTLSFCYDNGIEYYDVARSYGYGQAEAIVGSFAQQKRNKIIITSKFGIDPPASFPLKGLITSVARTVKNNIPASKKMLGKAAGQVLNKKAFTPQMVEQSLDKSLSELKTDYIDLYIYHESTFDEMMDDDIKSMLNQAKDKGKLLAWGANLAQEADQKRFLASGRSAEILQVPFALTETYLSAINNENQITVVYSVMNLYRKLMDSQRLEDLETIKVKFPELNFINNYQELFLYIAYRQLSSGVVLMSTTNTSHILRNIHITSAANNLATGAAVNLQQFIKNN